MLARNYRLRSNRDVSRVYRQGKTVRGQQIAIKTLPNTEGHLRAAVVVSKKVAAKAPIRNRIRRRLYELLRQIPGVTEQPVDVIISVFSDELADTPAPELKKQLVNLLQKS